MDRAIRLLVIEDDDDYREILRVLLRRAIASRPLETLFLSNVRDAQRVVDSTSVDAIVSDFHLPDGTGVDLLSHAKRAIPASRRIMLTGAPSDAQTSPSFNACVDNLWDKRLEPADLLARLEHLVHELLAGRGNTG
jgi:DNA-binding NtrC family response regulator